MKPDCETVQIPIRANSFSWASHYCSFHISLSNAFWRYLFYFYLFLAETFMICVNVFIYSETKSAGSDKKLEKSS